VGECLAAAGGCAAITGTCGDDVADRARVLDTVDTALQADRTGANADIGPPPRST
jgi:hypothetical protein